MDNNNDKVILVVGGHGYGNTGDEAQCNENLRLLTERYQDYTVIDLTPNVEYSQKEHPEYKHSLASREIFYHRKNRSMFGFNFDNVRSKTKRRFIQRSLWIYANAVLMKLGCPTLCISKQIKDFINQLRGCSLLYFSGGGYMTGSTLSRLYDGILLCRLAHLFGVPVVMSGQTIGDWKTAFNRWYSHWGLRHVQLITLRDENFSLEDLEAISLKGDHIFATHDDALFCRKSDERQVPQQNYITLNFHYWGMNEQQRDELMDTMKKVVDYVLEHTQDDIVFIPMVPSDEESYEHYLARYPHERLSCYRYDYQYSKIRRVIADSRLCLTMKHHPIIFAMGEDVPTISLNFAEYYVHKNKGAMMQYGCESYSIDIEKEGWYESYVQKLQFILSHRDEYLAVLSQKKATLKARKEKFLRGVDQVLLGDSAPRQ